MSEFLDERKEHEQTELANQRRKLSIALAIGVDPVEETMSKYPNIFGEKCNAGCVNFRDTLYSGEFYCKVDDQEPPVVRGYAVCPYPNHKKIDPDWKSEL